MCISQADKQKDRPIKKLTTEEAELSNIKDRKRRIHCKGTQGKKGFELTKRPRNRREQIKSKRKEEGKREKNEERQGERKGTNRGQIKEEGAFERKTSNTVEERGKRASLSWRKKRSKERAPTLRLRPPNRSTGLGITPE